MSDYTPTVEQLRDAWHAVCSDGNNRHDYAENAAEVDRTIESVRAEERERIARNIEAKTPDGRKSAAFCAGMDRAARIVREGA
ncbi:hypothetical protein RDI86_02025 [Cellulosimicrobium sp. XJ-DQ-B-000]|uniref:hypothetical protein n=1 Tax=Cellulosimicrobium sp. XJ-DQ-B-000 TaxID=3072182 RepID=UPI002808BA28|nr:hypothetical protein [Cellulosimicrobium sp. XJ-DQ-B-000]MDQ8040625.1 hypothetical protein [Cellulosimicrobium sp. XJ-DQ-B-000]